MRKQMASLILSEGECSTDDINPNNVSFRVADGIIKYIEKRANGIKCQYDDYRYESHRQQAFREGVQAVMSIIKEDE